MARSDKRYMVYPAAGAIEIIGSTSPSLNQALECWAALLARAMADNSKSFSEWYEEDLGGIVYEQSLHEWALLADALKEIRFDPEFAKPGSLLAAAVEDAHRLKDAGNRWFHCERAEGKWNDYDRLRENAISKLVANLGQLNYGQAWAIIITVRWFWEHYDEGIDIEKDSWWTLAFHRQWKPQKAKKPNSQGDSANQKQGKRKKTEAEKRK